MRERRRWGEEEEKLIWTRYDVELSIISLFLLFVPVFFSRSVCSVALGKIFALRVDSHVLNRGKGVHYDDVGLVSPARISLAVREKRRDSVTRRRLREKRRKGGGGESAGLSANDVIGEANS